jgi:hypothetical protein
MVDKAAQSAPLIGWVGSQEGPEGKMHTCTIAEMESVAADAGVGVQASNANRGNKSQAASKARKRGATPVVLMPSLVASARLKARPCCFFLKPLKFRSTPLRFGSVRHHDERTPGIWGTVRGRATPRLSRSPK